LSKEIYEISIIALIFMGYLHLSEYEISTISRPSDIVQKVGNVL
jgi:hypothetical protein